ncbi:MAG TPA: non-ribosomal peptide synthetase [Bryobacteraceae bacterium]|nr:non-ribosomal peptide synthetase [Bryobacteraceae bacterium]
MITETEMRQSEMDAETNEGVHELFKRKARANPAGIAVDTGARRVTYVELEEYAYRIAAAIGQLTLPQSAIIGILSSDPIAVIACVLGILKAGHAFMALDRNTPGARLGAMTKAVPPAAWLVDSDIAGNVESSSAAPCIRIDALPDRSSPAVRIGKSLVELAYIYFTSGSTGAPKAIAGTLKGVSHFVSWEMELLAADAETRVAQLTLPCFDGWLKDVFLALCSGGTVCALEDRSVIFEPQRFAQWLEDLSVTVLHCVPSLFRLLASVSNKTFRFPSLRHIVLAGERVLPADAQKWMDLFGERVSLYNFYGPTETTIIKGFHKITPRDAADRAVPIGGPIPGAEIFVLDGRGQACPPGIVGEIYIRTPYRTLGYYQQPELTRQCFVPKPGTNDPNDIFYRTGDQGRVRENGLIEFVGRYDDQVKIRGVRIECGEIESLLHRHQAVTDTCVVERNDAYGDKQLCAYLVLTTPDALEDVKDHVRQSLPEYMMPSRFVVLDKLPRTMNGKVNRLLLPAPEVKRPAGAKGAEPSTKTEAEVLEIWSEVLGSSSIGILDNFFQVGGHSLKIAQVISRIRGKFGVEIRMATFFETPTVQGISEAIDELILERASSEDIDRLLRDLRSSHAEAV